MRIGLITIHNANNYGAVLQTFALVNVLSTYGKVEVINYDNRHISRDSDLIRFYPSIHGLLGTGKDIFRIIPRRKAIGKFLEFRNRYINTTQLYSKRKLQQNKLDKFDIYISGSDQIWNPACVSRKKVLDSIYFCDFTSSEKKKISYASSLGSYSFSSSEKEQLKIYLKDFTHISVREKEAQLFLNDLLSLNVEHVLDPTLLLSKQEWLDSFKIKENDSAEKYILLYSVPRSKLLAKTVDYISKKLNLKVIAINQSLTTGAKVSQQIRDAGPIEFLSYFSSASFVITDSFHGTCFALNFAIPFVSVSAGKNINRVQSLLSIVGLEDRILKEEEQLKEMKFKINFDSAHKRLEKAKEESKNYLSRAIQD